MKFEYSAQKNRQFFDNPLYKRLANDYNKYGYIIWNSVDICRCRPAAEISADEKRREWETGSPQNDKAVGA